MHDDAIPQHLTVREAAGEAGRTPETIRRWVWSGRLTARKAGNRLVIDRGELSRMACPSVATSLAAWRDQLLEHRRTQPAARARSAVDLVLADRRHRSLN